jgi:tetratricopeptide (TPR) repeat protein
MYSDKTNESVFSISIHRARARRGPTELAEVPCHDYTSFVLPKRCPKLFSMPPRRAFILLFGTKTIVNNESAPLTRARCPQCAVEADFRAKSVRQWFTVFFLPLFPISGKMRFSECTNCRTTFRVPPEAMKQQADTVDAHQHQRTISLYNSLRNSPANSITLNELMQLHASMDEFDSALSAAAEFPKALNASEQCMVTLARIYIAKTLDDDAIKWLDAAVARNNAMGDAHYYRAVSLMNLGRTEEAIQSCRAARSAGFPDAESLLQRLSGKVL